MPLLNPSALEAFKASPGLLDGVFPSGAVPDTLPVDLKLAFGPSVVALGNTLPVSAVASFPSTVAFVADPTERFTLVLADPDAPSASSPTSRSFLHVIKPNLRALGPDRLVELAQAGEDAADGGEPSIVEVPKEELMPWRAPGPGKGSGAHRYVWLLVSQPNGELDLPGDHPLRNGEPEGRRRFNVETFARDVLGGGKVVGANFFVVEAEP